MTRTIFFEISRPITSSANIYNTILFAEQCESAMNQPWIFWWLSTRQCIRPHEILIFFYTLPPRIWWHNGECTVGWLSEYRRKMYNCLKFKCRCCCDRSDQPLLMYRVSSCCCVGYIIGRIIDSYIRFSRNLHACVAAGLEMRWIIAIWLMHERSRIVETTHICKCLSMHLRSELFIFKKRCLPNKWQINIDHTKRLFLIHFRLYNNKTLYYIGFSVDFN